MLELKFVQWDEAFSSHVFIMSKQSGYVSEENRIAFWGFSRLLEEGEKITALLMLSG
ncbi:hypothetical protein NDA03_22700 [Trichocoleus sp. Lan]